MKDQFDIYFGIVARLKAIRSMHLNQYARDKANRSIVAGEALAAAEATQAAMEVVLMNLTNLTVHSFSEPYLIRS